jgi:hypothetical protein
MHILCTPPANEERHEKKILPVDNEKISWAKLAIRNLAVTFYLVIHFLSLIIDLRNRLASWRNGHMIIVLCFKVTIPL